MGYHWDDDLKVCYYRVKGSGRVIYNYDDPNEFDPINEEQLVEEDDQQHA